MGRTQVYSTLLTVRAVALAGGQTELLGRAARHAPGVHARHAATLSPRRLR
jgi:hypothetical protein